MARMLPPINDGFIFRSEAEREVYEYLNAHGPSNWTVLHSVWLATSHRKEHSEIDFLLITNQAIICLEVKGGDVWRDDDGSWHFQSKDGKSHNQKNEGPFDQAKEAYYSARNALDKFGRKDLFFNRAWGYGVITPDCALDFRKGDAWLSADMLIDARDFPENMLSSIGAMEKFWVEQTKVHKTRIGRPDAELRAVSQDDHLEVMQILRPSIRVIDGPGISAIRSIRETNALTQQQCSVLDFARSLPRIMLSGLAGTGKTVLALEQAKRVAVDARVLFVCFNKNLADRFNEKYQAPEWGNVTFVNYHQLVLQILESADLRPDISNDWEAFNQQAVEKVFGALSKLDENFDPFDYLVIDEAQDLMSSDFFSVLDLLLSGGVSQGSWLMCFDPAQAIYNEQFDDETMQMASDNSTCLHLDKNCRNTRQVAAYVSGISKVYAKKLMSVTGPAVEIDYYENFPEYERLLRKHVNGLVAEFREMQIPSNEIVVLSLDKKFVEELGSTTKQKMLLPLVYYPLRSDRDEVRWSSIHAFKGLEATAVVVVFDNDLSEEQQRRLFYVAGSRARAHLVIIAPMAAERSITNSLPKILELITSDL